MSSIMPLLLYKPFLLTPLDVITEFKKNNPSYSDTKIGYAGRLDPFAEGLLLLLIDEENKKRKDYESLSKTYHFSCIFGITTDTYDRLGIVTSFNKSSHIDKEDILVLLPQISSLKKQEYPPYSSKTYNGKPLYYWARQNKLSEIIIPDREITISALHLLGTETISLYEFIKRTQSDVQNIKGDFRQNDILSSWQDIKNKNPDTPLTVARFQLSCSSGTYVRGLVHTIGEILGCGAVALTIKRTSIGSYTLADVTHFSDKSLSGIVE